MTDDRFASVKGSPRFGILRRLDVVETTTSSWVDAASLREEDRRRVVKHFIFHWDWGRRRLHGSRSGLAVGRTHTWDELLKEYETVTVWRWRRAVTWALVATYLIAVAAVILGFAAGGPWAVAATVILVLGFLGLGAAFANVILSDGWSQT